MVNGLSKKEILELEVFEELVINAEAFELCSNQEALKEDFQAIGYSEAEAIKAVGSVRDYDELM